MKQAHPWPRPTCLPTPTPSPIGAPHLVQVVGEVDNTEMLGMTDDMGYLFNDTGLPVDDGQVQGRVSVLVLCCQQVALSRQERARVRRDAVVK